jgi:diguanylate cyclase (GGDEF)-like protein
MSELETLSVDLARANGLLRGEISSREAVEGQLRFMATHDSLTGLLNRVSLCESLDSYLDRSQEDGAEVAVVFFDLDDFKIVNDSMGHDQGDRLLLDVGRSMNLALESGIAEGSMLEALAFRMGGDEFVVIFRTHLQSARIEGLCQRIQQGMMSNNPLGRKAVRVTISAGLSIVGEREIPPEILLREADTALYRAKLSGRGCFARFDDEMHESVVRRLQIESDLKQSTLEGDFTLVYQPILDCQTKELCGFEALLRWRLKDGTVVSPTEFIPIAERSGLISRIARWVLREAANQVAEWNALRRELGPLYVNVNMSLRQVEDPEFLVDLEALTVSSGFDPSWINLEITETAAMENFDVMVKALRNFRALGFGVQMDDFGTGYSSLSCLHQLPLDVVKIDRSFVADMEKRSECLEIIRAVIVLAHGFGMKVTAEGIEQAEHVELLKDLGCDYLQGFLLGVPMSACDTLRVVVPEAVLAERRSRRHGITRSEGSQMLGPKG